MKVCPNCGAENNDDSKFCETCGADLSKAQSTVSSQQPEGVASNTQNSQQSASDFASQQKVPPTQPYQGVAPQYAYPAQPAKQKSGIGKILLGVLIGVVGFIIVANLIVGASTGSGSDGGSKYDGTWVGTQSLDNGITGMLTIDGSDVKLSFVKSGKIIEGSSSTGMLENGTITWTYVPFAPRDEGTRSALKLTSDGNLVLVDANSSHTFTRQQS